MELRQLRQFIAVADAQSFRAAAERLFMAQPPLSVAIRKLEDELGAPLFERYPRGVALTAAGRMAYEAAQQCLARADDVGIAARQGAHGAKGRLKIGFIGSVTFDLLPRSLLAFRERYPDVTLELGESTNLELLSQVDSGDIDAAFVRLPAVRPAEVEFLAVQDDEFCVALPADHPLCAHRTLRLPELRDEIFIGYAASRAGGLQAGMARVMQAAGIAPRIAQEAVQVQTVLGLVGSGLGIALVPSANIRYFPRAVAFRRLRGLAGSMRIGIALAHRHAVGNPSVARFLETVDGLRKAAAFVPDETTGQTASSMPRPVSSPSRRSSSGSSPGSASVAGRPRRAPKGSNSPKK